MLRKPASLLVLAPLSLWAFSLLADVAFFVSERRVWESIALYTLLFAMAVALLAGMPGLLGLLTMRARTNRKLALFSLLMNLITLLAMAVNVWLRTGGDEWALPMILSIVSLVLLAFSEWFGTMLFRSGAVARGGLPESP